MPRCGIKRGPREISRSPVSPKFPPVFSRDIVQSIQELVASVTGLTIQNDVSFQDPIKASFLLQCGPRLEIQILYKFILCVTLNVIKEAEKIPFSDRSLCVKSSKYASTISGQQAQFSCWPLTSLHGGISYCHPIHPVHHCSDVSHMQDGVRGSLGWEWDRGVGGSGVTSSPQQNTVPWRLVTFVCQPVGCLAKFIRLVELRCGKVCVVECCVVKQEFLQPAI